MHYAETFFFFYMNPHLVWWKLHTPAACSLWRRIHPSIEDLSTIFYLRLPQKRPLEPTTSASQQAPLGSVDPQAWMILHRMVSVSTFSGKRIYPFYLRVDSEHMNITHLI